MELAFRREGLEGQREALCGGLQGPQEPSSQPLSGHPTHIPCSGWDQAPRAKRKPGRLLRNWPEQ